MGLLRIDAAFFHARVLQQTPHLTALPVFFSPSYKLAVPSVLVKNPETQIMASGLLPYYLGECAGSLSLSVFHITCVFFMAWSHATIKPSEQWWYQQRFRT